MKFDSPVDLIYELTVPSLVLIDTGLGSGGQSNISVLPLLVRSRP